MPISKLANLVMFARDQIEESGLVGDGNFHTSIVYDPGDVTEVKRADTINEKLVFKAIDFGGTVVASMK